MLEILRQLLPEVVQRVVGLKLAELQEPLCANQAGILARGCRHAQPIRYKGKYSSFKNVDPDSNSRTNTDPDLPFKEEKCGLSFWNIKKYNFTWENYRGIYCTFQSSPPSLF